MKTFLIRIHAAWKLVERQVLDRLAPIVDLAARLYVAKVFFASGWNKIQDWDTALYLFREEYHVPLLPPEFAAYLGAGGELGFSALLVIGLWTRFSAAGLFVLNVVAVVSYYGALKTSPVALQDHLEWGLLLGLLAVGKARQLTVDHLLIGRVAAFPSTR
ncbi:MAG: DoxX family protein [Lysobacterales bacterium]|jgi:putative oxidoreductase